MPKQKKPQEQLTIVTIDAEIVRCEARIAELENRLTVLREEQHELGSGDAEIAASEARINGLRSRLKVLRNERKKLESGLREDDALGGRLEQDMPKADNEPKLGGAMGSGSTL
jgi:predicted RNase H-like nuclease (RuvC/YqgF family)